MATTTAFSGKFNVKGERYADPFYAQRSPADHLSKPPKTAVPHTCPYCDPTRADDRLGILDLFVGGLRRLRIAVWMIIRATFRLARFLIGAILCLVGLVGDFFRGIGLKVAHPQDRRFFGRG